MNRDNQLSARYLYLIGLVLVTWILTGQHRSYLPQDGEFGPILQTYPDSVWELALRNSTLDLKAPNGEIWGGAANNLSLGLNCRSIRIYV